VVAGMIEPATEISYVQEFRLVSKPGKAFDYVAGLYYQRQTDSSQLTQTLPGISAYDDAIGEPNASLQGDNNYLKQTTTKFTDKAVFGELTYHITDKWQFTAGARFFWQDFSNDSIVQLPLCGAPCSTDQVNPNGLVPVFVSLPDHNHVKKFNTSYDISSTLKVYATYSEGFRHGGAAGLSTTGPFASAADLQTFKPDFAKNYELGVKGSLFEHRINYFADVYLVDLNNFQFNNLTLGGFVGAFNGNEARSQGLEFESQAAVTDHLNVGLGYAFTRSYVPKSFDILDYPPYALPAFGGNGQLASLFGSPIASGTPLPGISRNVVNASADYSMPTSIGGAGSSWTMRVDGSYRSSQTSGLSPTSIYYYVIPSAFVTNARLSLNTAANLTYSVFVRNATNNPNISGAANDQEFANPYRMRNVGTPRTFGLGVRYQFGKQ
jgi:iron complex outermembrane receptor protein